MKGFVWLFVCLVFFFRDKVSLCTRGCPGTLYVDHTGLKPSSCLCVKSKGVRHHAQIAERQLGEGSARTCPLWYPAGGEGRKESGGAPAWGELLIHFCVVGKWDAISVVSGLFMTRREGV